MKFAFRQSRFGIGAFATEEIPCGETIMFVTGEILSTKDIMQRVGDRKPRRLDDPFQFDDDLYILVDESSLYFNHSCDPTGAIRGHNELFAYRTIGVGEEITYDYSTLVGLSPLNGAWAMRCECGSPKCRKTIRAVSSIPAADLKEYAYRGGLPDFIVRQCARARPGWPDI